MPDHCEPLPEKTNTIEPSPSIAVARTEASRLRRFARTAPAQGRDVLVYEQAA